MYKIGGIATESRHHLSPAHRKLPSDPCPALSLNSSNINRPPLRQFTYKASPPPPVHRKKND